MLWLSVLVSWRIFIFVIFQGGYKAIPLQMVRVPLLVARSIPCQRGGQVSYLIPLDMEVLTHFTPPCFDWPCLLWPSSMSGHIHCWVHYLPASMGIIIAPSAISTCSFWGLQPHHITCGPHPSLVDTPIDIHGRSHNFLFTHPREALLVGCQVTALPLFSCGILFCSPLTEVVLHGVGLVHLSCVWWLLRHKGTPTSDVMRRSWFQWRTHDFLCWFITLYEGTSVAIWCTTSQVSSSHLSQIFLLPLKHLSSLVWGCQASRSPHPSFCCSTIFVGMLLLLIGLVPPAGQSLIYHVQKLHICLHGW